MHGAVRDVLVHVGEIGADWQFLLLSTRTRHIDGEWSSKLSSLQYTKHWLLSVFS